MSMLRERSTQRMDGKRKRDVDHHNYHWGRHSTNYKHSKVEAGNVWKSKAENYRNSEVDSNWAERAEASNFGVLNNSASAHMKSLVGQHKISDKQDLFSNARKLDRNKSIDIDDWDRDKLKQVHRDETCKGAQRKPCWEYRRKLKDEEDELNFSSSRWQKGDRASEQMNGSRRVSFNSKSSPEDHARHKHQGKCVPESTEAKQERKKYEPKMESAGRVPQLNGALDPALISKSFKFCIVAFSERQEAASRDKVLNVLKQFNEQYTQLMEEWKRKPKAERKSMCRADLKAARSLKEKGKWINSDQCIGSVPGVRVGDRFQYRSELAIIGLHREYVCGIHYEKIGGTAYATSIVDSGRYSKNKEFGDKFYYMGEGGNPEVAKSEPKDQTFDGGNRALVNSMIEDLPVRVIRGRQSIVAFNTMGVNTGNGFSFCYDGLYKVVNYTSDNDSATRKKMYEFELVRVTGDPNVAQMISYQRRKSTIRRKQDMVNDMRHQEEKMPSSGGNNNMLCQEEKTPSSAGGDMLCQEEKTPSSAGKDVQFTYNSIPDNVWQAVYSNPRECFVSHRNKDEKFNFEAAAHLAKPIVSTRHQFAKPPNTIPKPCSKLN